MVVFLPHFINILYILPHNNDHVNILLHRFNNFNNFVTLSGTRLRLPEDDADALKHAEVLTIYKILYIYIYMCVCVCVCICVCVCVCVVHLLVWIINCTKCTVRTSK